MQSQLQFPRYLDAPQRFLFWTVDQIIPFAMMAMVGMIADMLMVCLGIGALMAWGFARYRDSRPDGHLQHLAYWYGIMPLKGRAALNPFARSVFPQ